MWAAAKLGGRPPVGVADSLFAASQALLQQQAVNGAELMALTTAAAVLQLEPPHSWLQAVDAALTKLLLHTCAHAQPGHYNHHQQQQE